MPTKPHTFQIKRAVNVPPAEVYHALTNPTALRDWLANAVQAEPRRGGRLYLWWNSAVYATGEYTRLEPGSKVAFTWRHSREPEPARIQITLKSAGEGTALTLKHVGGAGKQWAAVTPRAQANWGTALENLQSVLETGIDLRVARLPRMGILVSDFNAEIAAGLGVPIGQGIRLTGTVEGTGARAAGLQADDVIVRLAGKPVTDFPSLSKALEGRQAGEVVPVVFYRGGEKRTGPLELSARPQPQAPPTAEALAQISRDIYRDFNTAVVGMIQGVSEAEAERRPAPDQWNIKELLAHYVACERDLQSWIAELLNGGNNAGEAQDSLEFRPNVTVRLAALVARYPTQPMLMEELERSQAETMAILAALPEAFVRRRHLYRRLVEWLIESIPNHIGEHRDQFQTTIAAARQSPN